MRSISTIVVGFLALAPAATAQITDCDTLRQQIAAASRGDAGRAAQYARAAQRQQSELERTQAYADQIGCSGSPYLNFGDEPPQCAGIQAQIARMTGNLNALQTQGDAYQAPDPNRQAALAAQYQTYCSVGRQPYEGPAYNGGLDRDPARAGDDTMRRSFDDPDQQDEPGQASQPRTAGTGAKAICVRTCDGGFFPMSYSGAGHDAGNLQALCSALCPNTEAKLYTAASTDDIGSAVAIDGARYADLPSAFKYTKTFDRTCTCKPPNKSWVEALGEAEKLIDRSGNGDVTVTTKMSEDMARPGATTQVPGKAKPRKASKKALFDTQAAAEGTLGAVGAQAPTASTDSAGIAAGTGIDEKHLRSGEGTVKTVAAPDGSKRRVRIIEPRP